MSKLSKIALYALDEKSNVSSSKTDKTLVIFRFGFLTLKCVIAEGVLITRTDEKLLQLSIIFSLIGNTYPHRTYLPTWVRDGRHSLNM